MPQDTSISGDAHSSAPLASGEAFGCDRSASEVVCTEFRDAEGQEPQLEALRAALVAGEASGEPAPFDLDASIADKRA
jgi:antitoxin ParD1/3/4